MRTTTTPHRPRGSLRFLSVLGAVFALLASLVVFAPTAEAHSQNVIVDCDRMSVSLENYGVLGVNQVEVWINGVRVDNQMFRNSFRASYVFDDSTVSNTWRVKVSPAGILGRIDRSGASVPCEIVPAMIEVIPSKYWDFGNGPIPADGSATVEITAGPEYSKTWVFDTSGAIIGDSTRLVLPATLLNDIEVSEPSFVNPTGWTCVEGTDMLYRAHQYNGAGYTFGVLNVCTELPIPTIPDFTIPEIIVTTTTTTVVEPTTTTTTVVEPTTTTTVADEVGGIVEEEVAGEEAVAPTVLPRTGAGAGVVALLAALMMGLGVVLRSASRRLT